MVFAPGVNDTMQENAAPVTVAVPPLHDTLATPEPLSERSPDSVTDGVKMVGPVVGDDSETVGGVRSMPTLVVAVAVLPATSAASPLTAWFAPSAVTCWSGGHDATPESPSVQTKWAVTGWLLQPLAFRDGMRVTVTTGGVMSRPNEALVTDARLPARSVVVPLTERFRPSFVTT